MCPECFTSIVFIAGLVTSGSRIATVLAKLLRLGKRPQRNQSLFAQHEDYI